MARVKDVCPQNGLGANATYQITYEDGDVGSVHPLAKDRDGCDTAATRFRKTPDNPHT